MSGRGLLKENRTKQTGTILILFFLSLVFYAGSRFIPPGRESEAMENMSRASKIMAQASAAIRECQKTRGLDPDRKTDPNMTGLIGLDFSAITTSLGNLEAKRTATNPDFAALVVYLLRQAGVRRGSTIAVGASSSFPGLIVAVLSAAKAMDLNPLLISSLGASQWGANNPDFHWLDMEECLRQRRVFEFKSAALSLGGERDTGENMSEEGRSFLRERIERSGIFFLEEPDLRRNVEARMRLYEENAGGNPIEAFINIGGSWASMGEDSEVLKLKPGLVRARVFPPAERRGLLFEMAARRVPVIHLLYIHGLAGRYGLAWDPVPLPPPGESRLYSLAREKTPIFFLLAALYLALVTIVVAIHRIFNWL